LMPYPFSRGVFICGEPLKVSPEATPEEMEDARARLEKNLIEITSAADKRFER